MARRMACDTSSALHGIMCSLTITGIIGFMQKCSYGKCKNEVKWRFSPDIDVSGLLACDTHLETVRMAYISLMTSGDETMCLELLNRKSEIKKDNPTKAL